MLVVSEMMKINESQSSTLKDISIHKALNFTKMEK
jgi:hypothetical protein